MPRVGHRARVGRGAADCSKSTISVVDIARNEGIVAKLVGKQVEIEFHQGWDSAVSLKRAIEQTLLSDRQRGYTQRVPTVRTCVSPSTAVSHRWPFSRGETKLFVMAMAVAQVRDLASSLGSPPVVLVDDLASELDQDSRNRCLAELHATGAQLFLTAIPGHGMNDIDSRVGRTFHVEQGHVVKVV